MKDRLEVHLLYKNMQEEYSHSKRSPKDIGGLFTAKLIREVNSLTTPSITKLSCGMACLRKYLSVMVSGEKMFPSMKPAPTKGNQSNICFGRYQVRYESQMVYHDKRCIFRRRIRSGLDPKARAPYSPK